MTQAIDVLLQTGASLVQGFDDADDDKARAYWSQLLVHFISEVTKIELAEIQRRTIEAQLEEAQMRHLESSLGLGAPVVELSSAGRSLGLMRAAAKAVMQLRDCLSQDRDTALWSELDRMAGSLFERARQLQLALDMEIRAKHAHPVVSQPAGIPREAHGQESDSEDDAGADQSGQVD